MITQDFQRAFRRFVIGLLCALAVVTPVIAQSVNNPSGQPLPRFATTRSEPINVRVGPGTRYDVAWVFVQSGQPVEIIQEFDTWRKIRDVDGEEGWVHQNLLATRRTGLVTPWASDGQVALRANPTSDGAVRAWLTPGIRVEVDRCGAGWCTVKAYFTPPNGRRQTFSGYVSQLDIWGVYPNEDFS